MMYEVALAVHIGGALVTGIVGTYALAALVRGKADTYKRYAIVLAVLAGFEIITGTSLSVLSLQVSAASLCGRIALYLSLVAVVELLLFLRMKQVRISFPLVPAFSPVTASLVLFVGALAAGF